jgi:hypothetical protein
MNAYRFPFSTKVYAIEDPGTAAGTYYLTVVSLSPKVSAQSNTADEAQPPSLIPNIPMDVVWAPVAVFLILFISTFTVMITGRIFSWKRAFGVFMVALTLSAIPYFNTVLKQGVSTQTHAGPEEVPRGIEIRKQTATSAVVVWRTDAASIGALRFGATPYSEENAKVLVADAGQKAVTHTVNISGLVPGHEYEMEIYSGNIWYDNAGTPLKFTIEK